jgi:hypothetical protein
MISDSAAKLVARMAYPHPNYTGAEGEGRLRICDANAGLSGNSRAADRSSRCCSLSPHHSLARHVYRLRANSSQAKLLSQGLGRVVV